MKIDLFNLSIGLGIFFGILFLISMVNERAGRIGWENINMLNFLCIVGILSIVGLVLIISSFEKEEI